MKILSRKILAMAILAVTAIATLCLGISLLISPVKATETSLLPDTVKVVNIEDVVNDITKDVYYFSVGVGTTFGGSGYKVYGDSNKPDIVNKFDKVGNINAGIFTRAALATDVDGNYKTNTNTFDNNISFYSAETTSSFAKFKIGTPSNKENTTTPSAVDNTLVRARLTYDADRRFVFATRDSISGACCNQKGVVFTFNGSTGMLAFDSLTFSEQDLLAEVNGETGTRTSLFTEGDSLIFTFGGYNVGTNTVWYFSVYNDTQKYMAIEKSHEGTYAKILNGAVSFEVKGKNLARKDALTIEGVNEPIFTNSGSTQGVTLERNSVAVGTSLQDITLPEGYVFADDSGVVKAGFNKFDAYYVPAGFPEDYYGHKGINTSVNIVALNVTNLEEVIDSVDDITYISGLTGSKILHNASNGSFYNDGQLNTLNNFTETIEYPESGSEYDVKWGIFTTKGTGNTTDIKYWKRTNGGSLAEETIEYNVNDYDGNLSLMNNSFYESVLWFNQEKLNRNSILSYRFNYVGNSMAFVLRSNKVLPEIWKYPKEIYQIRLGNDKNEVNVQIGVGYENILTDIDGNTASWNASSLSAEAAILNGKTVDTLYEKGDMLCVTYGAYDTTEGDVDYDNIYFYVYNETKGHIVCEKLVTVLRNDSVSGSYSGVCLHPSNHAGPWYAYNRDAVTFAGVNEPLITDSYGAVAQGDYVEDDKYSSVAMPEGYTFADNADKLLVAGENKISATTVLDEYYGKENITVKTFVTANVAEPEKYSVVIKDANGTSVSENQVKQGGKFTFTAISRVKDFVAFKDKDGALYNVGDEVTVNSDVEFTLLEIGFEMKETELRLLKDADGNGGLRYIVAFDADDYDALIALGDKVAVKSVIVPASVIGENFDPTLSSYSGETLTNINKSMKGIDNPALADGFKYSKFSITDIQYHNYHREFVGIAFIEITYADGDKAYVVKQDSACVYDLAVERYADLNFATSYGDNAKALIESYVFGVIDLAYTVDGSNITISMIDNANGLDLVNAYFTDLVEEGTVENGGEITVQINVATEVEQLIAGKTYLPIILRDSTNLSEYKMAIGTNASYNGGVLTVTFKVVV